MLFIAETLSGDEKAVLGCLGSLCSLSSKQEIPNRNLKFNDPIQGRTAQFSLDRHKPSSRVKQVHGHPANRRLLVVAAADKSGSDFVGVGIVEARLEREKFASFSCCLVLVDVRCLCLMCRP